MAKGGTAEFTVEVSGGREPYRYRWFDYYGSEIAGQTSNTFSFTYNGGNDRYYCMITDANRYSVTSDTAKVIEKILPLTITQQPKDVTVANGAKATLSVAVSGGMAPYTYVWQHENQGR